MRITAGTPPRRLGGTARGRAPAAPHVVPAVLRSPVGALLSLQRSIGNRAATRLMQHLATAPAPSRPAAGGSPSLVEPMLPEPVNGDGTSGVGAVGGTLVERATQSPRPQEQFNEAGLLDGELTSDVVPELFVDGDKTGTGIAWFAIAGGKGGAGNQGVGDITLVAPVLDSKDPPASGGAATVWVRPGTGTATVTRSFTGLLPGPNGLTHFITERAAVRADYHERLHVASSIRNHNAHITPLEARVAARTGQAKALSRPGSGTLATLSAMAALMVELGWNYSISNFRDADTADNQRGGTVDSTDRATADFVADFGPRVVAGRSFSHFIDTLPGPGP